MASTDTVTCRCCEQRVPQDSTHYCPGKPLNGTAVATDPPRALTLLDAFTEAVLLDIDGRYDFDLTRGVEVTWDGRNGLPYGEAGVEVVDNRTGQRYLVKVTKLRAEEGLFERD